ncbi:MAG: hypothetical protein ABR587_16635, partial [Candidatus Binatia bacterium]
DFSKRHLRDFVGGGLAGDLREIFFTRERAKVLARRREARGGCGRPDVVRVVRRGDSVGLFRDRRGMHAAACDGPLSRARGFETAGHGKFVGLGSAGILLRVEQDLSCVGGGAGVVDVARG